MSEDERPEDERDQDELIAAFAALDGQLAADELMRLLGPERISQEYYGALVRLATLLLDGDTALAESIARDSLAALHRGRSSRGDPGKAHLYLQGMVVNRARSIGRRRAAGVRGTRQAARDAPGAGHAGTGEMDWEPWVSVLRTLGDRQLALIVLHKFLGLPAERAAEVMRISNGTARSHLARGMSSLRPQPE
jgi:DNA-directed RNA polymerase specialized sigma24 family protein